MQLERHSLMDDDLKKIEGVVAERLRSAKSQQEVSLIRSETLGKKGKLGQLLRGLGDMAEGERKRVGQRINEAKGRIEEAVREAAERLAQAARDAELLAGHYDVTLPSRRQPIGHGHPLRLIETEVVQALVGLGFAVAQGPLVEHDWYNFEALNFPPDHPARDMQDSFFVAPRVVLRTHTSNVQIRTMAARQPPVRILAPGMVFRHDEVDPTHSPVFHQVEGLWVDTRVTFADLKGVLRRLIGHLFGPQARMRFRPSFFPFTEPSAEIDVSCVVCDGRGECDGGVGCRVCKGSGWLEILGAGMVDPAVLQAVGYDPEAVQGFAFGAGIERIAMLRWGVDDIRLFYENDMRFLQQFSPGCSA